MSYKKLYHQVATIKIRINDDVMTVDSSEQIYEERNPRGSVPARRVFVRVEQSCDEDDLPAGSSRGTARGAKGARSVRPPVDMPKGELLSPEEAECRRALFLQARKDRLRYINGIIRHYNPREVYIRCFKNLATNNERPGTPSDESSDEDWFPYCDTSDDDDEGVNVETVDSDTSDDTSDLDELTEDSSDSEIVEGVVAKKRKLELPETDDDSSISSISSSSSSDSETSISMD